MAIKEQPLCDCKQGAKHFGVYKPTSRGGKDNPDIPYKVFKTILKKGEEPDVCSFCGYYVRWEEVEKDLTDSNKRFQRSRAINWEAREIIYAAWLNSTTLGRIYEQNNTIYI